MPKRKEPVSLKKEKVPGSIIPQTKRMISIALCAKNFNISHGKIIYTKHQGIINKSFLSSCKKKWYIFMRLYSTILSKVGVDSCKI